MENRKDNSSIRRNLLLTGAAVLFVAIAFVLCLLLRPKAGTSGSFVIRVQNGDSITVPANETRTIVIRDGAFAKTQTGEGHENIIRIKNGQAWMAYANCPRGECMEQGILNAETARTRPLGSWIICMPHGVTVEYRGGAQ